VVGHIIEVNPTHAMRGPKLWARKGPSNAGGTVERLTVDFSAWFISGDVRFKMSGQMSGGNYAISGTAGFGLFLVVWFFFRIITAPA
jgi:hypothetical protein